MTVKRPLILGYFHNNYTLINYEVGERQLVVARFRSTIKTRRIGGYRGKKVNKTRRKRQWTLERKEKVSTKSLRRQLHNCSDQAPRISFSRTIGVPPVLENDLVRGKIKNDPFVSITFQRHWYLTSWNGEILCYERYFIYIYIRDPMIKMLLARLAYFQSASFYFFLLKEFVRWDLKCIFVLVSYVEDCSQRDICIVKSFDLKFRILWRLQFF